MNKKMFEKAIKELAENTNKTEKESRKLLLDAVQALNQASYTWTRATFIIREDLLKKLKDYAYTDRRSLKNVLNQMLEEFLKDKDTIER